MIFDGFIFFNEMDLLEIRLNELSSAVDRFIVVESNRTFTGKPKPLFFAENRDRYAAFLDRIIYILVDDMPEGDDPWQREIHQRNAIMRGLTAANDNDTLIMTDVDEIPRSSVICGVNQVFDLHMNSYGVYVNAYTGQWNYGRIGSVGDFRASSPEAIRHGQHSSSFENAGWHFSSVGGAKQIGEKFDAFSHQEQSVQIHNNRSRIAAYSKFGFGLFGGHIACFPIDSSFPSYLVNNQEKFSHLIGHQLKYESYVDSYALDLSQSLYTSEEIEWLYHISIGYRTALYIGEDREAKHALSLNVTETCDGDPDILFIEDPLRIDEILKSGVKAGSLMCGRGYDHAVAILQESFGKVDRIGNLWSCLL